jgi:hypothetical protein
MEWSDGSETLVGSINDPEHFAAQCVRLYTDRTLWEGIYTRSLESMRRYASRFDLERGVRDLLATIEQHEASKKTLGKREARSVNERAVTQTAA